MSHSEMASTTAAPSNPRVEPIHSDKGRALPLASIAGPAFVDFQSRAEGDGASVRPVLEPVSTRSESESPG
jgi:hypothetical protein